MDLAAVEGLVVECAVNLIVHRKTLRSLEITMAPYMTCRCLAQWIRERERANDLLLNTFALVLKSVGLQDPANPSGNA